MPAGTIELLADFVREHYWFAAATEAGSTNTNDFGQRNFNLTSTGSQAKDGVITYNFDGGMTGDWDHTIEVVLQMYGEFLGVEFQEVSGANADLRFFEDQDRGGWGNTFNISGGIYEYGEVHLDPYRETKPGSNYWFLLHEIGHSLGLGHSMPENGPDVWDGFERWDYDNDNILLTVMTYTLQDESDFVDFNGAHANSLMATDFFALEEMFGSQLKDDGTAYGPSQAFSEDTTWGFNTTITTDRVWLYAVMTERLLTNVYCIYDGDGRDHLDMSGYSDDQTIDLTINQKDQQAPVYMSVGGVEGNLTLAVGTIIEDATGGTGGDQITGNYVANSLSGLGGADTISGEGGNDQLYGGFSRDVLYGGTGRDDLYGGLHDDLLYGGAYHDTMSGDDGDDVLYGEAGNDVLKGGDGSDLLSGGKGHNTLYGGAGNDDYVLMDNDTTVHELNEDDEDSGGVDSIYVDTSFSLTDTSRGDVEYIENLTLTGSADINGSGNALDNSIYGNDGTNWLLGDAGSDVLYGFGGDDVLSGGKGKDTMYGGLGNDVYYIDHKLDVVTDAENGGDDEVYSKFSYSLSFTYIEDLYLSGKKNVNGYGSSFDNVIAGNRGKNKLFGNAGEDNLIGMGGKDKLYGGADDDTLNGGGGRDKLFGGAGDDYYILADTKDKLFDLENGGTDTVLSYVDISLLDTRKYRNLENITLGGTEDLNATGNEAANTINGNAGANVLKGEAGDDVLSANGGNDMLYGGADSDSLFGNAGIDILYGGDGNDVLHGGDDADTLFGGAGNDTYYLTDADDFVDERVDGVDAGGTDTVYTDTSFSLLSDVGGTVENLMLEGREHINGTGNGADNTIVGNDAYNTLTGNGGMDTIFGNGGGDRIIGGADRDTLYAGNDKVADTFVYTKTSDSAYSLGLTYADRIFDFESGEDKIDLSAIDANAGTKGNDSFDWGHVVFGSDDHTNAVWTSSTSTATYVYADVDGDAVADLAIVVSGTLSLTEDDFIL